MEELQPLTTESQVTRGTLTAQLCSTLEPTKNHECEEIQRAEPVSEELALKQLVMH